MTGPYAEDLAHVHHADFTAMAWNTAGHVRRLVPEPGLVVDLGCGSGVLAKELTDAGYDVVGYDISPAMVALAGQTAPRARFVCASVHDADLPGDCAAVTAVGECFNYLFDPAASLDLFARVKAALRPGGLFYFDVAGPGRLGLSHPTALVHGEGWVVGVQAHEKDDRLTRHITVFREVEGGLYRRSDEKHVLRLYEPAVVEQRLREAGFRVERPGDHGPGWAVFAAWA